ncbi:uncharacterized protein [Clytia hemisphaerica]|uniref:uncharacterized protein n=1 Tax=Clytia hemisphaerica TaxID=252671 RepID=UPI0034D71A55
MAELDRKMDELKLEKKNPINPVLRTILQGVADDNCQFSKLYGMPHVVKLIWEKYLVAMHMHINFGKTTENYMEDYNPFIALTGFRHRFNVKFPKPTDININMMPFVMAKQFENMQLPDYLKPYSDMIETAFFKEVPLIFHIEELGKIGYLTIHESLVEEGKSQRRPGLHTESPGYIYVKNGLSDEKCEELCIEKGSGYDEIVPFPVSWGQFSYTSIDVPHGGIYMASNVDDSCKVWDCQIVADNNGEELIRKHGDIEHLRCFLPESTLLKSNYLYWITDRTPHESLPLKKGSYRQFFRLVTHRVSVWYEDHSTKNPNGVVPDPKMTRIVKGSKFDENYVTIVG